MYGSTATCKESLQCSQGSLASPPTVSLRVDRAVLEQRDLQGRYSYHGSAVTKCLEKVRAEARETWEEALSECQRLPRCL